MSAEQPKNVAAFQCPFAHGVPRISTFRRDLGRAGISFVDEMGRRRDLHSLRKTFGTALLLNGESPYVVMHAMRHSDLNLTMKLYRDAQQFEQPLADAIGRLPWQNAGKLPHSEAAANSPVFTPSRLRCGAAVS